MTAVPAAVDALIAALTTSPALSGVRINDGPWLIRPSDLDIIAVGLRPAVTTEGTLGTAPVVVFAESPTGLGSTGDRFDVHGVASSYRGDDDMSSCRARADALLEALRGILLANHTLGVPGVSWARLLTSHITQVRYVEVGCEVVIAFVVRFEAFTIP